VGLPHHTTFNHWGNPSLPHLRNGGRDPSRSKRIKLEDGTPARPLDHNANVEANLEELDYIEKTWNFAALIEAAIKQATTTRYNRRVRPRDFDPGDLVLCQADVGNKNSREGKLTANWEGPYRVTSSTGTDAYINERPPNPKNMECRQT